MNGLRDADAVYEWMVRHAADQGEDACRHSTLRGCADAMVAALRATEVLRMATAELVATLDLLAEYRDDDSPALNERFTKALEAARSAL